MPGFFISNKHTKVNFSQVIGINMVTEKLPFQLADVQRHTLNKFMQDKSFTETADAVLILEGYLLNKKQLMADYQVDNVEQLMWKMYQEKGEQFFADFRGGFSGALYDKAKRKWLIFTNHMGDKALFYFATDDFFACASELDWVMQAVKQHGGNITFNEKAAYNMLTFAFMEQDDTYAQEIKRLRGGMYLVYQEGKCEVREYHTFQKNHQRFAGKSETEIIEELDKVFREAVELEYAKDEEYGYQHLADMSGGLDSRMAAWIAHTIKPRHMQLLTFCKANYLDELIAKEIACYWKDELLVKPLDDMTFIYEIDEMTYMNSGVSLYVGPTGNKRLLDVMNLNRFGLEHTGQIGDAVIGCFFSSPQDASKRIPSGRYSEKLAHRLDDEFKNSQEDYELYLHYTRCFNGAMGPHLFHNHYVEVSSPFLYKEFFQLCMDIPVELRIGHNIYKKWILSKYPDAAKFRWEKIRNRIDISKSRMFLWKIIHRGPQKIARVLFGGTHIAKDGMNPLDYWYAHDEKAQQFYKEYYEAGVANMKKAGLSADLQKDMDYLFHEGNLCEKAMVMTVLAVIKRWFV